MDFAFARITLDARRAIANSAKNAEKQAPTQPSTANLCPKLPSKQQSKCLVALRDPISPL
jgi:hypothetical protein